MPKNECGVSLSVGEVANRAGVAISTLHFYESKGLICSTRNQGNQRRYQRAVLRRIAVIKTAQSLGLSLDHIKQAFKSLPELESPTKTQWTKMSQAWRSELEQKIQQLILLRDTLDTCIGCGCLSLDSCPIRNPNDQLSKKGSGAITWMEKLKQS